MMVAFWLLFSGRLNSQPLLGLPQLGRERGTEIFRLEHLANPDFSLSSRGIGASLDPS
jgi:hypothetical protein